MSNDGDDEDPTQPKAYASSLCARRRRRRAGERALGGWDGGLGQNVNGLVRGCAAAIAAVGVGVVF